MSWYIKKCLQSELRMCVTRPAPDAGALIAPEREMQGDQHHGTHLWACNEQGAFCCLAWNIFSASKLL